MFDKGKNNLKVGIKYFIPTYFILIFIWYIFFKNIIPFSLGNGVSVMIAIIIFFNIIISFNIKFYGGGISLTENNKDKEYKISNNTKFIIFSFSMILIGFFLYQVSTSL